MTNQDQAIFSSKPMFADNGFIKNLVMLGMIVVGCLIVFLCLGTLIVYAMHGDNTTNLLSQMNISDDPQAIGVMKFFQVFSQLGTFVAPALIFAFLVNKKVGEYLRMNKLPILYTIGVGIVVLVSAIPLVNGLTQLNDSIHFPEALSSVETWLRDMELKNDQVMERFLKTDTTQGLIINILLIGMITAIAEEMFFRGVLLNMFLKSSKNIHVAVIITTILFAAIHFQFFKLIPMILISLFLGYVYVWTKSLWVPIFFHFFNNTMAVLAHHYLSKGEMSDKVETIGTSSNDLMIIGFAIVFVSYFVYRIYKIETANNLA